MLFVNPKGESRRWETYTVTDMMSCEFVLLKDIDGDGTSEFLFKDSENKFVYAKPDPANPTGMWIKTAISEPGPWANHGMGTGDINGDGRVDFVNAFGWWEQPAAKGTTVDLSSGGVRPLVAVEPGRRRDRRLRRQRRRPERRRHLPAGARLGPVVVRAEEGGRRHRLVRRAPDHGRLLDGQRRRGDVLASSTARPSRTSTATACRTSSPASGSGRTSTRSSTPTRTASRCCTSIARCAIPRRPAGRSSSPNWCTIDRASARMSRPSI